MKVEIKHLFVSTGHDFKGRHGMERLNHELNDLAEIECVAGSGIRGDRYFDFKEDFKGQITFFDWDVYEAVKSDFHVPDLKPCDFRRNVLIVGADLNALIGKRFRLGGAVFEGSEEAKPCNWMNEACAPGVEEFLRGKGGLRCRIRESGILDKGEQALEVLS